ncbi:hypothetical protein [Vibrio penaeicida]|nr:hypothetical protein [Vibrio penaeicida]RTZ23295.1 hypothetical protein EKN09_09555 [Vibrio penaeicida]
MLKNPSSRLKLLFITFAMAFILGLKTDFDAQWILMLGASVFAYRLIRSNCAIKRKLSGVLLVIFGCGLVYTLDKGAMLFSVFILLWVSNNNDSKDESGSQNKSPLED